MNRTLREIGEVINIATMDMSQGYKSWGMGRAISSLRRIQIEAEKDNELFIEMVNTLAFAIDFIEDGKIANQCKMLVERAKRNQ
jgi:hypothetical protein